MEAVEDAVAHLLTMVWTDPRKLLHLCSPTVLHAQKYPRNVTAAKKFRSRLLVPPHSFRTCPTPKAQMQL